MQQQGMILNDVDDILHKDAAGRKRSADTAFEDYNILENNEEDGGNNNINHGNVDVTASDSKHGKPWTSEEDHKMLELVELHGSRKSGWPIIAAQIPGIFI